MSALSPSQLEQLRSWALLLLDQLFAAIGRAADHESSAAATELCTLLAPHSSVATINWPAFLEHLELWERAHPEVLLASGPLSPQLRSILESAR